ncbi:hypothetical protein ABLE91_28290 [Aquabacter sp. CN5-332]|uniref:hypothetical protein n=1 Tax=Aquabacter sp. CN5-332 TaxID=3156608 RepID=UPI0032B40F17
MPALADLMGALQRKHSKLWFAGDVQNWELADYELGQIKANVQDAAVLYPGIPATNVTAMAEPIRAIDLAIEKKDGAAFSEGFKSLTAACNACHQGLGRGFIVIQIPTASPFTNQSFAPPAKQ